VLAVNLLQKVGWTSSVSPVISGDGQSLFFGVTRAGVQGWWENRFGRKPWTVELDKDPVVGKAPVPATPALSYDTLRRYVPSPDGPSPH